MDIRKFEHRQEASRAAAALLADMLGERLEESSNSRATLVVSGGSTPGPCFDYLSNEDLDWQRVTVIPSDERWVPADHPDSNERLVRSRLIRDRADSAGFLSFYREGLTAEQAPEHVERDLRALAQTFSAALLGMGEDGHFASLFPDFEALEEALEPRGERHCILVKTAGSPYLRISLTLSALLGSKRCILLIFGGEKLRVLEAAQRGDSDYPIESMLKNSRGDLTVIWAP